MYELATGKYKRSKPQSWGKWAWKAAAVTGGAQLGFIYQNVPGAVSGGVYASRAYDFTHQDEGFESLVREEVVDQTKIMGKFNGRLKKPVYKKDNIYLNAGKKGGLADTEVFGQVADPNCVYIHHSTYGYNSISFVIRFALIRKLFAIAGCSVVNRFEELPLKQADNSLGFRLEYVHYNPITGVQTATGYNTADNETLTDVTNSFIQFDQLLEQYMNGANPNKEPLKLLLYHLDDSATPFNKRLSAALNISDEEMHLYCYSNIKVQNRTIGDGAAAGDKGTERVDSQPVVCSLYEFSNADARLRSTTNYGTSEYVLNGCSSENVKLLRAGSSAVPAEFGPVNDFQNAPPKNMFLNCKKMSKTIINPGEIRESIVSTSIVGKGLAFFKKITFFGNNDTSSIVSGVVGKSQLLVFEEKMRTAGTNPVSVHYERKHKVACYSVTRRQGTIQPHLAIVQVNNIE